MLKILAAGLMLIDHLTAAFVPPSSTFYIVGRMIGRLSMPIFAYCIAYGFIHTRNVQKYLKRITMMTLLSQVPFLLLAVLPMLGMPLSTLLTPVGVSLLLSCWNIGLVFICAILILRLSTSDHGEIALPRLLKIFAMIFLIGLANWGDYGAYGVVMVILFYYSIKKEWRCTKTFLAIGTCTLVLFTIFAGVNGMLLQLPCVLAVILIYYVPNTELTKCKHFFYYFYPLHMLAIALLRILIKG